MSVTIDDPTDSDQGATTRAPEVVVATHATYAGAERAVDRLSDAGFPVEHVTIAGRGVSTLEVVTGRMTKGRAAVAGASGGLWFGLLLGLLLGLFVPGAAWISIVLTSAVLGGIWGGVVGLVGHWATRGRRDFSSVPSLVAERYEVMVEARLAGAASRILAGQ